MATPKTVTTTSTPYCSADELFDYHDPEQVADMLVDGQAPRPTIEQMLSSSDKYGLMVTRFLRAASGRVESACLVAKIYTVPDLQALYAATDTAGRELLVKLTADLCYWLMCQRRQPNSGDPRNVPGAVEVADLLNQLRDGQRIFSFVETQDAGLPAVVQPAPAMLFTPNVIGEAARLFPGYGINRRSGEGS